MPAMHLHQRGSGFFVLYVCLTICMILSIQGEVFAQAQVRGSSVNENEAKSSAAVDLGGIATLDLPTAQRIALADSPSLAAAIERTKQAQERVYQSLAKWSPRLDATGSFKREWLSDRKKQEEREIANIIRDFFPDTVVEFHDPANTWEATIGPSWTLFDGFRREFTIAATRHGEKESQKAKDDAARLLLSAVAESYYRAQLARESISVEEADELFNRRQMDAAKARQRIGTGSLSDTLNFEVQVNTARANLIRARQEYQATMIGLAALMGVPEARFPPHLELSRLEQESADALMLPASEPLTQYAQKHRPDILQRFEEIERVKAEIGIARSGFLPTIELRAAIEGESSNNDFLKSDDFGQSVAAVLTYNFFDGGATLSRYNETKFKLAEVQKTYRELSKNINAEVLRALAELKSSQDQLILQRENAILVRDNRDLVEKEYAAGKASLVRLNEAQRDLTTAQIRLARAQASLWNAWQDLKAATAEILVPFSE